MLATTRQSSVTTSYSSNLVHKQVSPYVVSLDLIHSFMGAGYQVLITTASLLLAEPSKDSS